MRQIAHPITLLQFTIVLFSEIFQLHRNSFHRLDLQTADIVYYALFQIGYQTLRQCLISDNKAQYTNCLGNELSQIKLVCAGAKQYSSATLQQIGLLYCLTTTHKAYEPVRQIFYATVSGCRYWASGVPAYYLCIEVFSRRIQVNRNDSVCVRKWGGSTVIQSAHSTMKCLWYGLFAAEHYNACTVGLCLWNFFLEIEYFVEYVIEAVPTTSEIIIGN